MRKEIMKIRDLANYIARRLINARKFLWWWILTDKEYWKMSDITMKALCDDESTQDAAPINADEK